MPYASNAELPDSVKSALPAAAQSIFRNAHNSAKGDEKAKNQSAWAAVKNAGWSKDGDTWVKKHYVDPVTGERKPKNDMRAANYRPAPAMEKSCATCVHFEPEYRSCQIVAGGEIRPDYVSDLWEQADAISKVEPEAEAVVKTDDDRNLVFGWASVAVNKAGETVVDHHKDLIDQNDLEDAAYGFVVDSRAANADHDGDDVGILVESMAFTDEKIEKLAASFADPDDAPEEFAKALEALQTYLPRGLWHGYYISDEDTFAKVKNGHYRMFSIEGRAVRDEESAKAIA